MSSIRLRSLPKWKRLIIMYAFIRGNSTMKRIPAFKKAWAVMNANDKRK